jgi:Spy/CpxP family protein refolding chaperone
MKRHIIILALLLIGSLPTLATAAGVGQEQAAPAVPEQARQRLEQIKERLGLTPEQIEQVRPILADEMQKLKGLRDSSSGGGRRDRRKMGREFKRIQGETDDRLEKVLSKEQMKELKKLRDEWRQQIRERAGQNRL